MSDDPLTLDPPIAAMFEATNRGDSEGFLAAFADDAVLVDWGRVFTGKEEIARWDANENIGVESHIEATGVSREGSEWVVAVQVTGKGYNGGGTFAFETRDGLIRRVEIRG